MSKILNYRYGFSLVVVQERSNVIILRHCDFATDIDADTKKERGEIL